MIEAMSAEPAGWGLPLDDALAEAAGARGLRNVQALLAEIDGLVDDPDAERLATLAARAGAMVSIERLVATTLPVEVGLAARLESLVTGQQIAWPVARDVMTSLSAVELPGAVARGLLAVVAELVAMVQADARDEWPVRLFMATEPDDGVLVFAFAAHGMADAPALGCGAARSLRRAERLACLMGGSLVRGFSSGMLIVGVTVALGTRS